MFSKKGIITALILSVFAVYITGCSSAESTTGKLAFTQGDYQKAEVELKKGLAIDKSDAEGWYMLGVAQAELGKFEEAGSSFKQATTLSKDYDANVRDYWLKKYNEGALAFQQGIDSEKRQDSVNAKKSYEKALNSFSASYYILPDSLKSLKAMAESNLALNKNDEAMKLFNDILAKSNNEEDAIRVAAILYDAGLGMIQTKNYRGASETFMKVMNMQKLPKDNVYYKSSAYNYAVSQVSIAQQVAKDNSEDYKPYLQNSISYLENLSNSLQDTDELKPQTYDLLIQIYQNLENQDKATEYQTKKNALPKK